MEDQRVAGVITESKSGRQAVLSKLCVDASGDGDVAAFAGADFLMGRMPIGLNMKIAGINMQEYKAFKQNNSQRFSELIRELITSEGV